MRYLIEFILAFVIVFLYYRIVVLRKKKKSKKVPIELQLFVALNNLDIKKLNNRKTMYILALLNSFIIALILLITEITNNFILKLLIATVLIFVFIIPSYKVFGIYYQKKGKIKNV